MDSEKMARFIAERRKAEKLTQRELAEKLGVTDKAVSKWERGLSCPDIALLAGLAESLHVTASELLNGERAESTAPEVEAVVEAALEYADTAKKGRTKNFRKITAWFLSGAFFIGILTCAICDFAINRAFTWSWYPISSSLFAWAFLLPAVLLPKRGAGVSLLVFTLLLLPFFWILSGIVGDSGYMLSIGIPCCLIGVVYLWLIYGLFCRIQAKLLAGALSLLAAVPVNLAVNVVLASALGEPLLDVWDLLSGGLCILAAAALAVLWRQRKKRAA